MVNVREDAVWALGTSVRPHKRSIKVQTCAEEAQKERRNGLHRRRSGSQSSPAALARTAIAQTVVRAAQLQERSRPRRFHCSAGPPNRPAIARMNVLSYARARPWMNERRSRRAVSAPAGHRAAWRKEEASRHACAPRPSVLREWNSNSVANIVPRSGSHKDCPDTETAHDGLFSFPPTPATAHPLPQSNRKAALARRKAGGPANVHFSSRASGTWGHYKHGIARAKRPGIRFAAC